LRQTSKNDWPDPEKGWPVPEKGWPDHKRKWVMCRLFIGADPALWHNQTRSFRLDGMVTSVRQEAQFWDTLQDIAARDDLTVPQLFQRLYYESMDEGHDIGNFASFLRVCCLRYLALQLQDLIPQDKTIAIRDLPAEAILAQEHKLAGSLASSEKIVRMRKR
jgi:predicted DNA-binding ribbon-helix-helix protein